MTAARPLLVLDLDETLIHSVERPLDSPADFRAGDFLVYRRPFLADFLDAAAQWFTLAVWSSASEPYVRVLVDEVFSGRPVEFVWARDRCTQKFDADRQEFYWFKNLQKLKRRGFRLERVLVIDDSPEKIAGHYGNHLAVSPFTGDLSDSELRDVLPFLERVRHAENFRVVEKRSWRQAGT